MYSVAFSLSEMMINSDVVSATVAQPLTSRRRMAINQMLNLITLMMMDMYLMRRKLSGEHRLTGIVIFCGGRNR